MTVLKVITTADIGFSRCWADLRGRLTLESELLDNVQRSEKVRQIINQVRQGGDKALLELTAAYDRVDLTAAQLRIPESQLQQAHAEMEPGLLQACRRSIANVRAYQEKIKLSQRPDWQVGGMTLGLRYRPVRRAGVIVPGASAPLPSTVIMTVVPAQVAGVKEIAVISAPRFQGSIHPTILGVCWELGIKEVYRISGAQGVAALAFGTDSIPRVDKIVGPSNWWGQLAKKEVFGLVDIDSFAGPSEVLIIADETANPVWVAADMLSQAEHAPGSSVLVTDSAPLAQKVAQEIDRQLKDLQRGEETRQFIKDYSLAVVTANLDESVNLANEFAAEHLQIQCTDSNAVAERIINAGAIFIGPYTPVATGDYFAGPSHTLPTGGSARFFSALSVNDFIKQSSIIGFSKDALRQAGPDIATLARAEGLTAHARSVTLRTESE